MIWIEQKRGGKAKAKNTVLVYVQYYALCTVFILYSTILYAQILREKPKFLQHLDQCTQCTTRTFGRTGTFGWDGIWLHCREQFGFSRMRMRRDRERPEELRLSDVWMCFKLKCCVPEAAALKQLNSMERGTQTQRNANAMQTQLARARHCQGPPPMPCQLLWKHWPLDWHWRAVALKAEYSTKQYCTVLYSIYSYVSCRCIQRWSSEVWNRCRRRGSGSRNALEAEAQNNMLPNERSKSHHIHNFKSSNTRTRTRQGTAFLEVINFYEICTTILFNSISLSEFYFLSLSTASLFGNNN